MVSPYSTVIIAWRRPPGAFRRRLRQLTDLEILLFGNGNPSSLRYKLMMLVLVWFENGELLLLLIPVAPRLQLLKSQSWICTREKII